MSKITVDICVLDRVPSKKKMSGMPGSDVIYSIMRISDIIGCGALFIIKIPMYPIYQSMFEIRFHRARRLS